MSDLKLNPLEQKFFDAFHELREREEINASLELSPQEVVGIYKVDFLYGKCIFEIDGHEHHKTKEQREYDYKRERYLMRQGYTVIRFTGTEVFLSPKECVKEAIELANAIELREIEFFDSGYNAGLKRCCHGCL